ncbi:MAG: formate dehydrogenase accessory sulfurtransferase FdhD [Panacagrimonas sp.]
MTMPPHSPVRVWCDDATAPDVVAEEVPVALLYNGAPHVVMMCTPTDLEDFARGFTVTENIVTRADDIAQVAIRHIGDPAGFEIDISIAQERAAMLAGRQRNLPGRSGCGLCGAQAIDATIRPTRRVPAGTPVSVTAIRRALDALRRQQPLNAATGATHAAAWATPDGLIVSAREDVGRHNALDKVIGHLLAGGLDLSRGFLLITSRASFEIVQKAVSVGMPVIVAISAPTALAVRVAEEAGATLIGFARGNRHVIYACPGRIVGRTERQ